MSGNAPSEVQVLPYLYNKKKLDWRNGDLRKVVMALAEQFSLFDYTRQEYHIDKPIRLIELFAGY